MSSGKKPGRSVERRPVGVEAVDRAEIGPLHLEAAAEIHLVGLDDAGLRVLQRPDHAGEHRRGHLQAGRVLVGRELARLLDRELRAVPIGVLAVAVEQHAELVDAVDDLVLVEDVMLLLDTCRRGRTSRAATAPRRCRVIGVVAGRPVDGLAALAHREVVGDRDRLVVGDEEAVLRAGRRAPGAHARVGAGLEQVDRRLRSRCSCVPAVLRHPVSRACPSRARPAACPPTGSPRPTRC